LYRFVFNGTPYAHPPRGTVAGLKSITLDDVRAFYRTHYTPSSTVLGIAGGYEDELVARLQSTVAALPSGPDSARPDIAPPPIAGREVLIVDKPGADASISFGFPIDVRRGERSFYALAIA